MKTLQLSLLTILALASISIILNMQFAKADCTYCPAVASPVRALPLIPDSNFSMTVSVSSLSGSDGPNGSYNQTASLGGNVGKIQSGQSIIIKIFKNLALYKTDVIPSHDITSNGLFYYQITVTGEYSLDSYTLDFIYGDQSVEQVLPMAHTGIPPIISDDCNVKSKRMLISPLQQLKMCGSPADGIICNDDLQLVIKSEDGSPACVMPETAVTLIQQEWAKNFVQSSTIMSSDSQCQGTEIPSGNFKTGMFPVLLMQSNTTATVCITYNSLFDWNSYPNKQVYPSGILETCCLVIGKYLATSQEMQVRAEPPLFNLTGISNNTKITVVYKIHAGSNLKRFYDNSIPHSYCLSYPMAVGYDASQVNASDFSSTVNLLPPCFLSMYDVDSVKIVSGMAYKEIQFP